MSMGGKRRNTGRNGPLRLLAALLALPLMLYGLGGCGSPTEHGCRDIEVSLPDSSAPQSLSSATKLVIINVRSAEGRKEGDPLYLVANQPMTLEQLRDTVRAAVEENVNQEVLIRGDKLAFHGEVAAAVSACREAGVQEVKIGYDFKPLKQTN